MASRESATMYPSNLTDLLHESAFPDGAERLSAFQEHDRLSASPASTLDDGDSSQSAFGVDLTGKTTNLMGKSFTIAAILGLTSTGSDVMNLSVQERFQDSGQRQLHNYFYRQESVPRLSADYCRSVTQHGRHESTRPPDMRGPQSTQIKSVRAAHPLSCSNNSGRSKRIRTIFTPEQLERLEAEFERQQYMVGPERLYLAHALQLTEAQVKVWFQNRRIKWRKHHLEVTQQRLAVLQRHRGEDDDDV